MTEMVEVTRRICSAVACPVIADADCGYGNPLNVVRTVRALEAAGAAGLHIEDQVTPKRCGHMADKTVIPSAEMVAKIAAATDARKRRGLRDHRPHRRPRAGGTRRRSWSGRTRTRRRAPTCCSWRHPSRPRRSAASPPNFRGRNMFNWAYQGRTPHVSRRRLEELGFAWILFADVALAVHQSRGGLLRASRGDRLARRAERPAHQLRRLQRLRRPRGLATIGAQVRHGRRRVRGSDPQWTTGAGSTGGP